MIIIQNTNERAIVFIQLHITYLYCVLHFVPSVSIVMAALHERMYP